MELTEAQKAIFPDYLAAWCKIGLSNEPADRPTAEEGVHEAYKIAGFPPPRDIYWLGSPLAGTIVDTVLAALISPTSLVGIPCTYSDKILNIIDTTLPVLEAICTKHNVPPPSRDLVLSCLSKLQLHNAAYGQHDASILCFYDFFAKECGVTECEKLSGINKIARSCGWWWAYDSVAILTERPLKLTIDSAGRLHSDTTWAILYPDGFGYCLDHGVEVPPHVVLHPETITIAEIESETNVEVRRVMMGKYGQSRFLLDSGAVEIHKDDWGTLYRKDVPEDEPLIMVKVVNSTPEPSGESKDYCLRVPPDTTTARAAVAWTFAQEGDKYHPQVET